MEIGDRLRFIRKDYLGKSQQAFAGEFGVARDTINNIERNRLKNPQQHEPLYRLICIHYNISYEWLKTGEGEMLLPLCQKEGLATFAADSINCHDVDFKNRLITALNQMTQEQWKALEIIIDALNKV